MKLDELHIGASPLTDRIYLGTVSKRDRRAWSTKVDCTSTFIGALMEWTPPGTVRLVNDNHGNSYEIEVRKLPIPVVPETLPVGTKLYTHPQPSPSEVRDAERYRWLRDENNDSAAAVVRDYGIYDPAELDAFIDAAIQAKQAKGTP